MCFVSPPWFQELAEQNAGLKAKLEAGYITRTEFVEQFRRPPRLACGKASNVWCARFKSSYQWKVRSMSDPCNYLPEDHPKLQAHRVRWKQRRALTNVPFHLFLNYDQVWRMKYRGLQSNLYKRERCRPAGRCRGAKAEAAQVRACNGEDAEEKPGRRRRRRRWCARGQAPTWWPRERLCVEPQTTSFHK